MLSNAYFLAKFRFDTAENEPAKNFQNSAKTLPILLTSIQCTPYADLHRVRPRGRPRRRGRRSLRGPLREGRRARWPGSRPRAARRRCLAMFFLTSILILAS